MRRLALIAAVLAVWLAMAAIAALLLIVICSTLSIGI